MKLKWNKVEDEYLCDIYYILERQTDEGWEEIADLWFDYYSKNWYFHIKLFNGLIPKKFYKGYGLKDVEDVQFHAVLDLQAELNNIIYESYDISNEICDYISFYLEQNMVKDKDINELE